MSNTNHRILLRARPEGVAGPEHFSVDAAPPRAPGPDEVALETLYVSVDPAMRVWLGEAPGYVTPVKPGEVMRAGGIGRVVESRASGLAPGDLVLGRLGWQTRPTVPAASVTRIDPGLGEPLDWLGPLGTTGLTAYFGVRSVGRVTEGETVVVSAAAGGVGQVAAQVAKLDGARVVGIAGGPEKCAFLTGDLGLDAVIDRRGEPDIGAALERACPDGIDFYFDNVGGPILEAVLDNLRVRARVAVCGRISQTALRVPHGIRNLGNLIGKRARVEGFLVSDFADEFSAARHWLAEQLRGGELRHRLHVLEGLERAPEGLTMLFSGENIGKLVVSVGG